MSKYIKYTEQIYEVYTFHFDIYVSRFDTLKGAIDYCESNDPMKYSIKKVIGRVA